MSAKKSITKATVKASIIKQLEDKGADIEVYLGLVDDYLYYFVQEKLMQADVRKNGRTYKTKSAQGVEIEKDNPNVKNAFLYNKQKLAILKELGIDPNSIPAANVIVEDDDL